MPEPAGASRTKHVGRVVAPAKTPSELSVAALGRTSDVFFYPREGGTPLLRLVVKGKASGRVQAAIRQLKNPNASDLAQALSHGGEFVSIPQKRKIVGRTRQLVASSAPKRRVEAEALPDDKVGSGPNVELPSAPGRIAARTLLSILGRPPRIILCDVELQVEHEDGRVLAFGVSPLPALRQRINQQFDQTALEYGESGVARGRGESAKTIAGLERKRARLLAAVTHLARGQSLAGAARAHNISSRILKAASCGQAAGYEKRLLQSDDGTGLLKPGPRTTILISRKEDTEFASLMGTLWSTKPIGINKRRIVLSRDSVANLEPTKEKLLRKVAGCNPQIHQPTRSYHKPTLTVVSARLAQSYNRLTINGRALPWAILETRKEKWAFLAAVLDERAVWSRAGLEVRTRHNARRLVELALLMRTLGISPLLERSNGFARLIITDSLSFGILKELGLPQGEKHQRELARRISKIRGRVSLPAESYWKVMDFKRCNPQATLQAISDATGVPISTFRSWERKNASGDQTLPAVIKRDRALLRLRDEYGIGFVEGVSHFYRRAGLSIGAARAQGSSDLYKSERFRVLVAALGGAEPPPDALSTLSLRVGGLLERILKVEELEERELQRRGRIQKHAEALGVVEPGETTLVEARLVGFFIEKWRPFLGAYFRRRGLAARGMEFAEIESLAAMRALSALKTFDPAEGMSFTSYGYSFLKKELDRSVNHLLGLTRAHHIARQLARGERPGIEEVQQRFRAEKGTARRALALHERRDPSLDAPIGRTEEGALRDLLSDSRSPSPEKAAINNDLVARVLSLASERERSIVTAYYWEGKRLAEIASDRGCSIQNVQAALQTFLENARRLLSVD